jgi:hypothetical protein
VTQILPTPAGGGRARGAPGSVAGQEEIEELQDIQVVGNEECNVTLGALAGLPPLHLCWCKIPEQQDIHESSFGSIIRFEKAFPVRSMGI